MIRDTDGHKYEIAYGYLVEVDGELSSILRAVPLRGLRQREVQSFGFFRGGGDLHDSLTGRTLPWMFFDVRKVNIPFLRKRIRIGCKVFVDDNARAIFEAM